MVDIYVRWIKAGRMTIDKVPAQWLEGVRQKLSVQEETE